MDLPLIDLFVFVLYVIVQFLRDYILRHAALCTNLNINKNFIQWK